MPYPVYYPAAGDRYILRLRNGEFLDQFVDYRPHYNAPKARSGASGSSSATSSGTRF
jgi:hypothetical protein